jgi:hypothetical protein
LQEIIGFKNSASKLGTFFIVVVVVIDNPAIEIDSFDYDYDHDNDNRFADQRKCTLRIMTSISALPGGPADDVIVAGTMNNFM